MLHHWFDICFLFAFSSNLLSFSSNLFSFSLNLLFSSDFSNLIFFCFVGLKLCLFCELFFLISFEFWFNYFSNLFMPTFVCLHLHFFFNFFFLFCLRLIFFFSYYPLIPTSCEIVDWEFEFQWVNNLNSLIKIKKKKKIRCILRD